MFVPSDLSPTQLAQNSMKRGIFGSLLKNNLEYYFPNGKALATEPQALYDSAGAIMWEVIAIRNNPAHLRPKSAKFWFIGSLMMKKNMCYKLLPAKAH